MTLKTPFIPTPWGLSISAEELLPGVTFVQTPSHGGYHPNAAVNARPAAVRVMIRQAFPHLELP